MDQRSYVEVVAVPYDGEGTTQEDIAFAMSSILAAVHLAAGGGSKLSVSFPGIGEFGVGSVVRIFGSEASLSELVVSKAFVRLVSGGLAGLRQADGDVSSARTGAILSVPPEHGWAVFRRSREFERGGPGYIRRTEARLRRRVEGGKSSMTEEAFQNRRRKLEAERRRRYPPFVQMDSLSTERRFRLYVGHVPAASGTDGGFDSYGLSVGGATVPVF